MIITPAFPGVALFRIGLQTQKSIIPLVAYRMRGKQPAATAGLACNEEVKGDTERDEDMKDDGEDAVTVVTAEEDNTSLSNADSLGDNIQYQFPADGGSVSVGSVTYRVVSVTQGNTETSSSGTRAIQAGSQPALAQVIQTPYNSEDTAAGEGQSGETRFTYFPASAMSETNGSAGTSENQSLQSTANTGGQFYVMMSPQDVLQGVSQRTIAPRTHQFAPKIDAVRTARDDRRRATHNEVERRRRDKINNWIVKLSKLVPDCTMDQTKQGQSKGGILMKTCEYIDDLKTANSKMAESLKETERLSVELEILRQQVEELKNENTLLRAQLQQHGVDSVPGVNS